MAKRIVPVAEIEKFLKKKYQFRRNPVLERTECAEKGKNFRLLTERDFNSLFRELNNAQIECNLTTLRSILNSNFVQDVDPFQQYFDSIDKWDEGNVDYIQQLANTVETTNQENWVRFFKKWLVAVVACSINPEVVNHQVLVLVGAQGLGKSTWLNNLLPDKLDGYLYSGLVNPNNKDTLVNLSENLLINLDELENLNKSELGSLKALITQSAIRLRRAYGVFNEKFTRRASFMGSVNDAEFLTDTTGNRRYLCFTCTAINYNHEVDMDRVYAQAYALYQSGKFKYWFDKEETKDIERINEEYLRVSVEEDLLLKYFTNPGEDEEGQPMTTTDIAMWIKEQAHIDVSHTPSIRKLGMALVKHGYRRKSIGNTKPYLVVKLPTKETFVKKKPTVVDEVLDYHMPTDDNSIPITDTDVFKVISGK